MNKEEENASFKRNSIDMSYVDLNSIGEEKKEETPVETQNIVQRDNLNTESNNSEHVEVQAKKPEIHIEPLKSIARDKDRNVKKIIIAVFALIAVILFFLIRSSVISNKYVLFVRNVKVSAQAYIEDSTSASYVSALYNEKIEKIDITLSELKSRGFITFEVKDPRTGEDLAETKVRISIENGSLVYEYPIE